MWHIVCFNKQGGGRGDRNVGERYRKKMEEGREDERDKERVQLKLSCLKIRDDPPSTPSQCSCV